jgi:hypothetical protein
MEGPRLENERFHEAFLTTERLQVVKLWRRPLIYFLDEGWSEYVSISWGIYPPLVSRSF